MASGFTFIDKLLLSLRWQACYFVCLLILLDNIAMKTHRVNELIELLHPAWQEDPDLNLIQFLQRLAQEAGFQGNLTELSDDILIYHLKMRGSAGNEQIPGLKKDYEEDFKTALLRARGVIKD
ncbi:hypothetical protein M495_24470 [Serratia liquefaciens ATCC 27592]|jgi:uncharacterized protein|nr:hypothetical protein M495_24470 [Serratia liquefaciens ATCC 27592]